MPVCGSGAVVCSWSLLFAAIIAVVRQKLHLSSCADFRGRLKDSTIINPMPEPFHILTYKTLLKVRHGYPFLQGFHGEVYSCACGLRGIGFHPTGECLPSHIFVGTRSPCTISLC